MLPELNCESLNKEAKGRRVSIDTPRDLKLDDKIRKELIWS